MIIETSDNRFYLVSDTMVPDMAHCWNGYRMKRSKGAWVFTAQGQRDYEANRPELVRKAATRIVEQ